MINYIIGIIVINFTNFTHVVSKSSSVKGKVLLTILPLNGFTLKIRFPPVYRILSRLSASVATTLPIIASLSASSRIEKSVIVIR